MGGGWGVKGAGLRVEGRGRGLRDEASLSYFVFRDEISVEFRTNFNFVFRENFAKLKENFAKHETDNFAKFSRKHENENFCSTLFTTTKRVSVINC